LRGDGQAETAEKVWRLLAHCGADESGGGGSDGDGFEGGEFEGSGDSLRASRVEMDVESGAVLRVADIEAYAAMPE
jgi:hypothetical protein